MFVIFTSKMEQPYPVSFPLATQHKAVPFLCLARATNGSQGNECRLFWASNPWWLTGVSPPPPSPPPPPPPSPDVSGRAGGSAQETDDTERGPHTAAGEPRRSPTLFVEGCSTQSPPEPKMNSGYPMALLCSSLCYFGVYVHFTFSN